MPFAERKKEDAFPIMRSAIVLKMLVQRIYLVARRFSGMPTPFNYAIADGLYNLLFLGKTA
jgi:hypothetical protein